MGTKRAKVAAEQRLAATLGRLEEERQERDRRREALHGAVVRRQAALDTREEVEAAARRKDPDAALVERLDAERRERQGR